MVLIDQSQAGQSVDLPLGQVVELRLKENPTTGFSWSFTANGAPNCAVLGDSFTGGSGQPGQGGEHAWRIKAVRAGPCMIALVYRRPFEQGTAPAQSFEIRIEVGQ
jgi:inhibitor of cysteine peptidase